MSNRRTFLGYAALLPVLFRTPSLGHHPAKALDPRGRIHIPIGNPDTLDTLKTFVEAEGALSPDSVLTACISGSTTGPRND